MHLCYSIMALERKIHIYATCISQRVYEKNLIVTINNNSIYRKFGLLFSMAWITDMLFSYIPVYIYIYMKVHECIRFYVYYYIVCTCKYM